MKIHLMYFLVLLISNEFIQVIYSTEMGVGKTQSYAESALRVLDLSETQRLEYIAESSTTGEKYSSNDVICKVQPFVTVSYAQTIDGSIAPLNRTRLDISSKTSFSLLHSLRASHDGVLVGINTVVCDQPRLNVRDPLPGVSIPEVQPRPIVIDSELRLLEVNNLLLEKPIVFTCICDEENDKIEEMSTEGQSRRTLGKWKLAKEKLRALGGNLMTVSRDKTGHCDISECLHLCRTSFGMNSVLIEGGAGIIQAVVRERLAHQFIVTVRPSFFGGYRSMTAQLDYPHLLENLSIEMVEKDVVIRGTSSRSKD